MNVEVCQFVLINKQYSMARHIMHYKLIFLGTLCTVIIIELRMK